MRKINIWQLATEAYNHIIYTTQYGDQETPKWLRHWRVTILVNPRLVARHSDNAFHSINEVTLCQARLVLWRVTACGQVNHLRMYPAT